MLSDDPKSSEKPSGDHQGLNIWNKNVTSCIAKLIGRGSFEILMIFSVYQALHDVCFQRTVTLELFL